MKLKVKYLNQAPKLKVIEQGDWIDLYCNENLIMNRFDYKLIPLGVCIELPKGYEAIVAPRSSLFKNFGIIQANSLGIIDESYKGDNDEWHFPAICLKEKTFIPKGERICQFRILSHQPHIDIVEVDSLGNADRGGIGSTGTCDLCRVSRYIFLED